MPWSSNISGSSVTEQVYIGGATGAWTGLNALGYPPIIGVKTSSNTFTTYSSAVNVHFATQSTICTLTLWHESETSTRSVQWSSGTENVYLYGFTGEWAILNGLRTATKTSSNTITVPVDTSTIASSYQYNLIGGSEAIPLDGSTFGSFAGQSLAMFPYNSVSYSYQGQGWWDLLFQLALCYKVLGNSPTAYGTKAVAWLDYITSLGAKSIRQPVSADSYYATRFTLPACAVAFDWCYDLLSTSQRAQYASAINSWYDTTVSTGLEWSTGPLASNYHTGHMWGLGSAGIACLGDNSRSTEITGAVRSKFSSVALAGLAAQYQGGYPFESYGYGSNAWERLLYYTDAVRTSTGENINSNFGPLAQSLIYNFRPDKWRVGDEGDYPGAFVGVLLPSYPITLAHVLAGTTKGGWMQYLYDNLAPMGSSAGQALPTYPRLLWYDSTGFSANYTTTEPTQFYSSGDCRLFWRSDWSTSAVWFGMNGAANTAEAGHQAHTAGHLNVQRGSDLLMSYSGQYQGSGGTYVTSSNNVNVTFRRDSIYANTLLHQSTHQFTGEPYEGGQGAWGVNDVRAHETSSGNNYSYLKTDLTTAYDTNDGGVGRTLLTYLRSAVKAGTGTAIVCDYARTASSVSTTYAQWHFNQESTVTVSGQNIRQELGHSINFVKALLPTSATLNSTRDATVPGGSTPTTYLIQSKDPAPSTIYNGLHIIQPGSTSASTITASLITSSNGNMNGAQVIDSTGTIVAMFSASSAAVSSFSYRVA